MKELNIHDGSPSWNKDVSQDTKYVSSHVGSSLILNNGTGSSTLSLDFESLS